MLKTIISALVAMRAAAGLKNLPLQALFGLAATALFLIAIVFAATAGYQVLSRSWGVGPAGITVAGVFVLAGLAVVAIASAYGRQESASSMLEALPNVVPDVSEVPRQLEKAEATVEDFAEKIGPVSFSLMAFMLGIVVAQEVFGEVPEGRLHDIVNPVGAE